MADEEPRILTDEEVQQRRDRYDLAKATGAGSSEVVVLLDADLQAAHETQLLTEPVPEGEEPGNIFSRLDGGSVVAWLVATIMEVESKNDNMQVFINQAAHRIQELQTEIAELKAAAPKKGGLILP